ncbi:MAG: tRNA (guanosine(37)-N1)-methyltransferase TrmD [Lachnospiraceae bacterium]
MNFYVLTLFPEMIEQGMNTSIIGRAIENNLLKIEPIDIRQYSKDKHKRVDDYPYGGGAGMVMQAEPISLAYEDLTKKIGKKPRVIYLTPWGNVFNQTMAKEFAKEEDLIFLCGHYEGVDERILEEIVTDPVSIGDYVLTGGELPAMVMMDAISRMVPGVLTNDSSKEMESHEGNLLEYPQYTRPAIFHEKEVPAILLSGHHANIEKWRREKSIERTKKYRPDLLKKAELTEEEKKKYRDDYEKN